MTEYVDPNAMDIDAKEQLIPTALSLVNSDEKLYSLHRNILALALPDSARIIAAEVMKLAKR